MLPATPEPPVVWRQLGSRLWSASRDGRPLGTIERGRRYAVLDDAGEVLGRHESLEAAMSALVRHRVGDSTTGAGPVVEKALFAVTGAFGVGAVAVIGFAIASGIL